MKTFSRLLDQDRSAAWILAALASLPFAFVGPAHAQGSRKDDIVFGPGGHPVAGATITVCQATATGTPCSPLATIYTDATLTVPSANPFQGDGIGNYHFYAPAGRYQIQITAPTITGTISQPDVILPPDVSSSASGNNISAFGLTLGGNLSVAGNANVTGALTASSFSPGSFTPSSLSVTGSETIQGPRPRLDVTAYGAKGDGWTDDTAAIQTAINADCAGFSGTGSAGPYIFFPPGVYVVKQTQLPSTAPVFNFPSGCAPTMIGGAGGTSGGAAFPTMARGSEILVNILGSSPNNAPVFLYSSANSVPNGRIENLTIEGHNQAVAVVNSEPFVLENVCLTTPTTGQTDNTPLKITDTFWFYFKGGCLTSGSAPLPVFEITGETVSGADAADQLIYFSDILTSGGGGQIIQRAAAGGAPMEAMVFRNMTFESGSTDLMTISESGSPGGFQVDSLLFDNVNTADWSNSTASVLNINATDATVSGVTMEHVAAGNGGAGKAITVNAGNLTSHSIRGCAGLCVDAVADSSGNPTGMGNQQRFTGGVDSVYNPSYIVNGSASDRLQSQYVPNSTDATNSPANRWFISGNPIAGLGVDPTIGFLFNDNASWGFNAALNETSTGFINFNYADMVPPASLAGTAASGGSLANGTYTAVIRSTSDNCTTQSGPSAVATGVVLSGSNGAINWTWSLPTNVYTATIAGYCLTRGVGANQYTNQFIFISGGSTTSYSDTGAAMGGGVNPLVNKFSTFGTHKVGAKLVQWGTNNHIFAATGIGNSAASPPYAPACMGLTTCGSSFALSPIDADNFTRASASNPGTNWTNNGSSGSLKILSNTLQVNATVAPEVAYFWNGQSFANAQFSKITIGTAPSTNTQVMGPTVFAAGAAVQTWYHYACVNDTGGSGVYRALFKTVAGSQTAVETFTTATPCSNGDTMELDAMVDASGNTHLIPYRNGAVDTALGVYTDSSSPITSGSPGIAMYVNTGTPNISAWAGGNLPMANGVDSVYTRAGFYQQPQHATFLLADQGAAQSNGNISLSGGWGSGAAVSASAGFAQRIRFTITAGTSPSANPTITVTFPSAFPSAPLCIGQQTGGTGAIQALTTSSAETTTTAGIQWNGTPANGSTYVITVDCR